MTTIETTSIPDAIDFILATIRALELKNAAGDLIPIYDGMIDNPSAPPDDFVCVGGSVANVANGVDEWASLGGPSGIPQRDERYTIDCYLSCYVGGSGGTDASMSDAQKTARDHAFVIFRAIEVALRSVPKLGTIITSGWSSFADAYGYESTPYDDPDAAKGRWATVPFNVAVYRRKRTY